MSDGGSARFTAEPCPLCAAPIVWARDDRAATVPVDAEPAPAGTVVLRPGWDGVPRMVKPSAKLAFGVRLHAVHYQTCRKGKMLRERGR